MTLLTGEELVAAARSRQSAAVAWITNQLDGGQPRDYAAKNTWWRVPWALSVAGATVEAAAVLGWAEREALDGTGDLVVGPAEFSPGASPIYELSAISIAAWRLGRYDLANRLLDRCRDFQSPQTGGVYDSRDRNVAGGTEQDLLKTCQLGVAAVIANRRDIADPIAGWVRDLWSLQKELPRVLYPMRDDSGNLVTPGEQADMVRSFYTRVDFHAPFQAYYNPGIAAAFLFDFSGLTGTSEGHDIAQEFLRLNLNGAPAQFDDPHSVQICKYGWGVATALKFYQDPLWATEAERMTRWFIDRQNDDGSWSPSTFGIAQEPPPVDRLWKTAEHLMELTLLIESLTARANVPRLTSTGRNTR